MYVFSGQSKIIYLQSGVISFDVKNLYSSWKDWVGSGDNSKFLPAFLPIGGDPISSTKNVAGYYFLTNDWRIRPWESSHSLNIEGNLFVNGGTGNPLIPTTGNYNVFINISTSSDSTIEQVTNISDNSTLVRIESKVDDVTALVV